MIDLEEEPFYKRYYRQQTPLKKLKLRWKWFLHGNTVGYVQIFFCKLKYGWSYDPNPVEPSEEE